MLVASFYTSKGIVKLVVQAIDPAHHDITILVVLLLDHAHLGLDLVDSLLLHPAVVVDLSELLENRADLSLEVRLRGIVLVLDEVLELADLALPNALILRDHLLLSNDDILDILELFLNVEDPEEVSDHRDFLLGGGLHFDLLHTIECVSHDGDQQVHEQELCQECCHNEKDPDKCSILSAEIV